MQWRGRESRVSKIHDRAYYDTGEKAVSGRQPLFASRFSLDNNKAPFISYPCDFREPSFLRSFHHPHREKASRKEGEGNFQGWKALPKMNRKLYIAFEFYASHPGSVCAYVGSCCTSDLGRHFVAIATF